MMFKLVSKLIVIVFVLFLVGCKKDLCEYADCRNGAKCDAGFCTCADFYEGDRCEFKMAEKWVGTFKGKTSCLSYDSVAASISINESSSKLGTLIFDGGNYIGNITGSKTVAIPIQTYFDALSGANVVVQGNAEMSDITIRLYITRITSAGSSTICTFVGTKQ